MQCKKCKGKMDCTGHFVGVLEDNKNFKTFYCQKCKTEDTVYDDDKKEKKERKNRYEKEKIDMKKKK